MPGANERAAALGHFDAIYAEHAQALHAYFVARTSDVELARDLVQETCVRLWRSIDDVAGLEADRRRAWLFTVARNLVVDTYRSRASAEAREVAASAHAATIAPAADADVGSDETIRDMDHAIAQLPQALREVLVLSVLGERNSTEIGAILARPPGTVRYQLAEARRLLARMLEID